MLLVNADVVINPLVSNSVSFLKKIVLTSDGTSTSATGVFLDGSTSKIGANYICNAAGTGCKAYTSLALPTCKDYQMLKYS
ncbi:TPA: hypothetical protein DEP21_00455 [Patescibacteria group bacterium]|nr:hypothetical protein [Candidatus Gracilibacteria bacterium]